MRVTSLASGSSGNALLVEAGPERRTRLLIDAGLPGNILIERLRQAGAHPTQLQGVLVTHEHSDHITGLPVLTKRYNVPIITAPDTLSAIEQSLTSTWTDEWARTGELAGASGKSEGDYKSQNGHKPGEVSERGEGNHKGYTCPPDSVPLLWTGFVSMEDTSNINTQNIQHEAENLSEEQAPGYGDQPLHFMHDKNDRQNVVAGLVPARSIQKSYGETISFQDTLAMPLQPGSRCQIGDIEVISFPVSHDALAPCGYLLSAGGCRICVAIDSGEVTPIMLEAMHHADLLVLESNHDRERLLRGPYPYHLKMRILSPTGHLSNDQAAEAVLHTWRTDSVRWLWLSHLSRTNNTPRLALKSMLTRLENAGANLNQVHITVLPPGMGTTWDSTQLWESPALWKMPL
jgi:phosphoribosyl 1,2-cyclic phosphodiesterase